MKRVLFVLMALLIASPAMAVTFTVADNANLTATIGYAGNGTGAMPDATRARAFGLKISVDGGAIITGVSGFPQDGSAYGIYPGTIVIDNGVATHDTPVEPADLPGADGTGLNTSTIIVAMGSLYATGATPPGATGDLLTITVDKACNVKVEEEDQYRGGVVAEDAAPMTVAATAWTPITGGAPAVCKGDADNDGWVTTDDLSQVVTALSATAPDWYFETTAGDARDMDTDGWITTDDLSQMVTALAATAPDWYYECQ